MSTKTSIERLLFEILNHRLSQLFSAILSRPNNIIFGKLGYFVNCITYVSTNTKYTAPFFCTAAVDGILLRQKCSYTGRGRAVTHYYYIII